MKTKKILRFYFSAESLERAFDNIIMRRACDAGADALDTAERLCSVISDKIQLEKLWAYLDGILSKFSLKERGALATYAARRAPPADRSEVNRLLGKFTRRARRIGEFSEGMSALDKYGCLIRA